MVFAIANVVVRSFPQHGKHVSSTNLCLSFNCEGSGSMCCSHRELSLYVYM